MIKVMLTAGIAAVLLLAACGDDEGEDTESFVADADALCADRNEAVAAAYDETYEAGGGSGLAPEDAALEGQVAAEEELSSGLGDIEAPSELEGSFEEIVTLQEKRTELLSSADASLHEGNIEAMDADRALASIYQDEGHAVARGLGMIDCAQLLPEEDEAEVTAAVEAALTDEGATSVEIDELEGHADYAEADVLPTGGRYDNEAVRVLVRTAESGEWEVAQIIPAGAER